MIIKRNPFERMSNQILIIRGQVVLLDEDLAKFYGEKVGHLGVIVKKHVKCFPQEIMFRLNRKELAELRCQTVAAKSRARRQSPLAFTTTGVVMLSRILNMEYPFKKNQTCGRKCHVYSREFICIRPVGHWNKGKQEEFKDRKCFIVPPLETTVIKKRVER